MDERVIETNSNEVDENILEEDNIEDLLVSNYNYDIPLDSNHDMGNDFMSDLCRIPTKKTGCWCCCFPGHRSLGCV